MSDRIISGDVRGPTSLECKFSNAELSHEVMPDAVNHAASAKRPPRLNAEYYTLAFPGGDAIPIFRPHDRLFPAYVSRL